MWYRYQFAHIYRFKNATVWKHFPSRSWMRLGAGILAAQKGWFSSYNQQVYPQNDTLQTYIIIFHLKSAGAKRLVC